jgi:uncharacterized protein YjbJ (UPF0337 family)
VAALRLSVLGFFKKHLFSTIAKVDEPMSIDNRAKATGKNIEGKIQETVGKVTGNPQDEVKGRAKQQEASAEHTVENIKDDLKKVIDGL